jgi:PPE-repeat protein
MAIDFGAMPPEFISSLLYSGPGASSLVSAASAWKALAAELTSAAQGYDTVVLQLVSEGWLGGSAEAMAAAVQPYVTWMSTTAAQAEQAGAQALSAAANFETAFASAVPPPMIAANRAELQVAQQTNLFGLNNGLIAQLEALYAEMWATDSSTMFRYAASSAATTSKVESFTPAPSITNPAGTTNQAAAVTAAQATPAASTQSAISNKLAALSSPTQQAATQAATTATDPFTELWFLLTGQTSLPTSLGGMVNGYAPFASLFYNTEGLPYFSVGMGNFGTQIAKSAGWLGGAAPAAAAAAAKPPGLGAAIGGAAGSPVAAGLGNASHVGHLAVPSSWSGTTSTPTVRPAVQLISEPITSAGESGAGNVLGGMPVTGTGAGRGAGTGPRYGFKPTVMARPMSAG